VIQPSNGHTLQGGSASVARRGATIPAADHALAPAPASVRMKSKPPSSRRMGEVYRARDTRLDRTVAIKVLPQGIADDAERRSRFEREAKAVAP